MNLTKTLLKKIDNKEIISYNVRFDNGFEVEILNLGGIITKIITPDKNGNLENVVVGYKDIESYIQNPSYFGAIIGRTAGRICEGEISIDGLNYELAKNYNSKIWDLKVIEEDNNITLKLYAKSLDMEENYPGNLDLCVSFKIYENYKIEQTYEAVSDKKTLVNMTNHSYFNLSGDIKRPIIDEYLKVDCDYILELDKTCVPTGKKISVENTPFDFKKEMRIGDRINHNHKQIQIGCGYDHIFVLNNSQNQIKLNDRISGRNMRIDTDQNCVVIYSMNFPDDIELYNGKKIQRRYGICFETQAAPIGRDMCFIEDSLLNKGEKYTHKTTYTFSIN
ncbi:aldose epimerase family protein [Romboutsia ilealis]|uniref:aldose epimerase family protein n=1 Tax=Romboutsia ilealis TaxID=1115758 RepID=UPI002572C145|nr:aldose epimerase family protein [Romboutsia ilealis]